MKPVICTKLLFLDEFRHGEWNIWEVEVGERWKSVDRTVFGWTSGGRNGGTE
jgi:hypothetical protein